MNKTVKAYDNSPFLHSDGARPLRILAEYMEPDQRLQDTGVHRAVIFFGSARVKPGGRPDYYGAAADLAEKVARWTLRVHRNSDRLHICTGGGPGIMEAAHAGGARVDAGLNIGLNISLPFEQHLNPYIGGNGAFEFHYFFMRKFWLIKLAAAAVFFPGGFGTMDELFELLTLTQTGRSARMPIVLFSREYWEKTLDLRGLARRGFIEPEDLELFSIVDSVDEAYEVLRRGLGSSRSDRERDRARSGAASSRRASPKRPPRARGKVP